MRAGCSALIRYLHGTHVAILAMPAVFEAQIKQW